ncbi:hypothetical protein LguiA_035730 [Lonicera macranthoides]
MIGTLTLPSMQFTQQGNRFSAPRTTGSARKISFTSQFPCKASLHAFAEVDSRRKSLYEVLRVNRNASSVEIKTAYRSLAKMYHPDSSQSEESNGRDFIKIHNAYATLSDPSAREIYDLSLSPSSSSGRVYSMGGRQSGFYCTRRWETDQCW